MLPIGLHLHSGDRCRLRTLYCPYHDFTFCLHGRSQAQLFALLAEVGEELAGFGPGCAGVGGVKNSDIWASDLVGRREAEVPWVLADLALLGEREVVR